MNLTHLVSRQNNASDATLQSTGTVEHTFPCPIGTFIATFLQFIAGGRTHKYLELPF